MTENQMHYHALPPSFWTLDSLQPGLGYWVKTNAGCVFSYPIEPPPGGVSRLAPMATRSAPTIPLSLSPTWCSFYSYTMLSYLWDGSPIPYGTEIRAFYIDAGETLWCGQFVLETSTGLSPGQFGLMDVYGDDPSTTGTVEGPGDGDTVRFLIDGVLAEIAGGDPTFLDGGIKEVSLEQTELGISKPEDRTPKQFALYQCIPNPFNPVTTIQYDLPAECHVRLEVFDVLGRPVDILVDKSQTAGRKAIAWDSRKCSAASGVYLYRLVAGEFTETKRMVLVR